MAADRSQRVTERGERPRGDNRTMAFADWLAGRKSDAARMPERLDELCGPAQGTIVLPKHLSFPGMRECDVTDEGLRRSMYGAILTLGQRHDVARYLNPELLSADWPLIKDLLDPKLRRTCERRFALGSGSGGAEEPAQV
jgi:hypothetical protein